MNKVGGYNAYQNNFIDSIIQQRKDQRKTSKSDSSKKTDSAKKANGSVQLSDRAKALLQELKKTDSNMDFIVADYNSDEEASSYLSRGTKEYTVLIDSEELERMAADDSVKEQNLKFLDEATGKLDELKSQLGDNKDEVVRIGISIGKDGEISFFAELEKMGERQKEFIDNIREGKKENPQKSEADKTNPRHHYDQSYERGKRTTIRASSIEELLDKISNVDWDSIKEENTTPMPGGRFNSSI